MSEPHFQNISNYQSKKNEEFMSNAQIEHFKTKLNGCVDC
jgi:hypothetical protein